MLSVPKRPDESRSTKGGASDDEIAWRDCVATLPAVVVHRDGRRESVAEPIVREVPFTIYLNDMEIVTLLCTGINLECLALGFLRSEGLIQDRASLEKVEINESEWVAWVRTREQTDLAARLIGKRTITSGCGKGSTFYNSLDALAARRIRRPISVTENQVRRLMTDLHAHSDLYRETHGVHNCALADKNEILLFRADIGRHNALDMIVGECFRDAIPTEDKILLTTGRITSEILIKAAKVGIPVIVSRSSATNMAVQLAKEMNITAIGRVRAGGMVLYSGSENVVPS